MLRNFELKTLTNKQTTQTRKKSVLNFLGSATEIISGNLDEDAERYDKAVLAYYDQKNIIQTVN